MNQSTRPNPIYKDNDVSILNSMQSWLENEISNYELVRIEDLDDQENEQVVRSLWWSRGIKEFFIVLAPRGGIRGWSNSIPKELLVQCHNTIAEHLIQIIEENTETKTY